MYKDYYKISEYIILIEATENAITTVKLVEKVDTIKRSDIIEKFKLELDLYFKGKLKFFTVPYIFNYLEWRQKLYLYIKEIKYGTEVPIKSLLTKMGLKKGIRAISSATRDNNLIIIIPCHRVKSTIRKLNAHCYNNEFRNFLLKIEKEGNNYD